MATDAARLLVGVALALGLALLVLRGGRAAVRMVTAQGVATALTAGLMGGESVLLALAGLLLLIGSGAGGTLLAAPARGPARVGLAVAGAVLAMLLVLALPREAVADLPVRRDDLALALMTALLGALVVARGAEWRPIGVLALANGVALVGLAASDAPVVLAAALGGMLVAGLAGRTA